MQADKEAQQAKKQYLLHAKLSRFTEKRKRFMPMDGTLDIWVLGLITFINMFAAAWGLARLYNDGAFDSFGAGSQNILWLGVIFAFVDCVRVQTGFMFSSDFVWVPSVAMA